MEYPDVFGASGAMSPSFWCFDDAVWKNYLSQKTFGGDSPFIYLYTGPEGGDTDPYVTEMYNRLKDMGYPDDKLALHFNENGGHETKYWQCYLSEFLEAAAFEHVDVLQ